MTKDATAQATATEPPPPPTAWATESWTWASQPGSPVAAALMVLAMVPPARLAGNSQRNPMPHQTMAQTALPPDAPSGPSVVAGPDAVCTAVGGSVRGHTRRPMAA